MLSWLHAVPRHGGLNLIMLIVITGWWSVTRGKPCWGRWWAILAGTTCWQANQYALKVRPRWGLSEMILGISACENWGHVGQFVREELRRRYYGILHQAASAWISLGLLCTDVKKTGDSHKLGWRGSLGDCATFPWKMIKRDPLSGFLRLTKCCFRNIFSWSYHTSEYLLLPWSEYPWEHT